MILGGDSLEIITLLADDNVLAESQNTNCIALVLDQNLPNFAKMGQFLPDFMLEMESNSIMLVYKQFNFQIRQ